MSLKAGLVGLPNVGKSTLFNALTKSAVPAENYPFCTINPHNACTNVPDERIERLQNVYKSEKIIPAIAEFVDIAGLVKGASTGEGLGNQFLGHIREVSLILHVVRCFTDSSVTNTQNAVDPFADLSVIKTELALRDLESINQRLEKIPHFKKKTQNAQEKALFEKEEALLATCKKYIDEDDLDAVQAIGQQNELQHLKLLSSKPFLIIANISENDIIDPYKNCQAYRSLVDYYGNEKILPVSAKIESELSQMDEEEAQMYAGELGINESGLKKIIRATYKNLGLITFFTCGPKEIHAWPIENGITIKQAAGVIHSDLEKGFICAHVFSCDDIFMYKSEHGIKQAGKFKTVGSDYIVVDGDIVHVQFNV